MNSPFFTQSRFPALYNLYNYWIGSTVGKRRLCTLKYRGHKRVLEVGCSVGNIAQAFLKYADVHYTGIDVDCSAIDYAQQAYKKYSNLEFQCVDFMELAQQGRKFDYILFANCFHHIDDETILNMLHVAPQAMTDDGLLIVIDPVLTTPEDSRLMKLVIDTDQGQYVRSYEALRGLIQRADILEVSQEETHFTGMGPWEMPRTGRIALFTLKAKS